MRRSYLSGGKDLRLSIKWADNGSLTEYHFIWIHSAAVQICSWGVLFLYKSCELLKQIAIADSRICSFGSTFIFLKWRASSCGLLKNVAIADMQVWTNISLKSCGHAVAEVLTSSCVGAIADVKNMRMSTSGFITHLWRLSMKTTCCFSVQNHLNILGVLCTEPRNM